MTSQAALTTLETYNGSHKLAFSTFSESSGREMEVDALLLEERQNAANDGDIDTSSAPFKLPSTFTRFVPLKRTAPEELAEWSGCVTNVQEEGMFFTATLSGVKGLGVKGQEEDARIPISDVADCDKELLRAGNYFRLCVMQGFDSSGDAIRYTKVIFRRLPAYRQQDIDEALERGRELARGLRVE